jgi:hypothetical protein
MLIGWPNDAAFSECLALNAPSQKTGVRRIGGQAEGCEILGFLNNVGWRRTP